MISNFMLVIINWLPSSSLRFVGTQERCLDGFHGFVDRLDFVPVAYVVMKKAGFVEVWLCQPDEGDLADGINALSKFETLVDLGKEIFYGVAGIPSPVCCRSCLGC
jgi:hypothetical protein